MFRRKRLELRLKRQTLVLGERTLIMGILNLTPDSFSDGGKYSDPDRAFARALELEDQGADIIDIGGESTRPGSTRVSEAEEIRRLAVVKRLIGRINVPISIDTYKAAVAERVLEWGADVINDPSGLTWEPPLVKAVAQRDAAIIINHMRGTPETWAKLAPMGDPVGTVRNELEAAAHRAVNAGVDKFRVVIDPGFGFGKRKDQNFDLLAGLNSIGALNLPVLAGVSRKSFLAHPNAQETESATIAAVTAAVLAGAHIVRVHDVPAAKAAVQVADGVQSSAEGAALFAQAEREAEQATRRASKARASQETRQSPPERPRPRRSWS